MYPILREEMAEHNHSISDLAHLIGCKSDVVRDWLCGNSPMEVYFAVQIAKVYERSIDDLFSKGASR